MPKSHETYRKRLLDWQDESHGKPLDWDALEVLRAELREAEMWDLYGYSTHKAFQTFGVNARKPELMQKYIGELRELADAGNKLLYAFKTLCECEAKLRYQQKPDETICMLDELRAYLSQNTITDNIVLCMMNYLYGQANTMQGNFNDAMKYFHECCRYAQDDVVNAYYRAGYYHLGQISQHLGHDEKAIEAYSKSLKVAKKYGSPHAVAVGESVFGDLYAKYGARDMAIEQYQKFVDALGENNRSPQMRRVLSQLGLLFYETKEYDKAIEKLHIALEIQNQFPDYATHMFSLVLLAQCFIATGQLDKAFETLTDIDILLKEQPQVEGVKSLYDSAMALYNIKSQNFDAAETYLHNSLQFYEKEQMEDQIKDIYSLFATLYTEKQQYQLALEYRDKYDNLKNKMEADQKQTNLKILIEKVETQEEIHRADIARASAEAVANAMRESITYASKIQRGLLPPQNLFEKAFADVSILWEPRDIVGGDIYWIKHFERGTLLCLADCTGHGVPAALLTALVVSDLESIANEGNCDDTAHIMYQLDQRLSTAMTIENEGCDIAILFIAPDGSIKLSATGVYIFVCDGKEVVRHKGQKFFIGEGKIQDLAYSTDAACYSTDAACCVSTISLPPNPDAVYYLASDGLFDQMNMDMKRFGLSEFKNIAITHHSSPLSEVTKRIWEAFVAHKGEQMQYDDVAMVGFIPLCCPPSQGGIKGGSEIDTI